MQPFFTLIKRILLVIISVIIYQSCQPQDSFFRKDESKAVYKYAADKFILLDSSLNRIDTILIGKSRDFIKVFDVKMYGNKCILIYGNNDLIGFLAFEKEGKWHSSLGDVLILLDNQMGGSDFKIIDENHIQVKEQIDQSHVPIKERKFIEKTQIYTLDYAAKKSSFTETIVDHGFRKYAQPL